MSSKVKQELIFVYLIESPNFSDYAQITYKSDNFISHFI